MNRYIILALASRSIYQQFCSAKNKGRFRKEHSAEIALYETARNFLKSRSTDGRLPSMKLLKEEKELLSKQKKEAIETYHSCRGYHIQNGNASIILFLFQNTGRKNCMDR